MTLCARASSLHGTPKRPFTRRITRDNGEDHAETSPRKPRRELRRTARGRMASLLRVSASLAFGDIVRVVQADETAARGIAGGIGMVVGVRFGAVETVIVGGGQVKDAALVSLTQPVEETLMIARRLLESTGELGTFEIIDSPPDREVDE